MQHILSCLAVGLALAGAPGPVQAVLLAEAVRGGVARGLSAMAGAAGTFGLMLVAVALGLSTVAPRGAALRLLEAVGGGYLIWVAVDGYRTADETPEAAAARPGLPPALRGALAVLLNPGAWLFLGTAATSLVAGAAQAGGRPAALAAAFALLAGAAGGDAALVVLGGTGLRRGGALVRGRVRRVLAAMLGALGAWVLLEAVRRG
jgi:threonine/homoserine/homoserine lactone efflux protein